MRPCQRCGAAGIRPQLVVCDACLNATMLALLEKKYAEMLAGLQRCLDREVSPYLDRATGAV